MVTSSVSQKGKVRVMLGTRSSPVSNPHQGSGLALPLHQGQGLPAAFTVRGKDSLGSVCFGNIVGEQLLISKCLLHMPYSGRTRVLEGIHTRADSHTQHGQG